MSVREILILPDPLLRKVAEPVESFDDDLQKTVDDMFETRYDAPGIGLAGPQIGFMKRVIVIDLADEENPDSGKIAMVNPEIVGLTARPGDEEMPEKGASRQLIGTSATNTRSGAGR